MNRQFIAIKLTTLLLFVATLGYTQDVRDTLAKDNVSIPLPTIGINFGITHLMGDVALSSAGPSPFTQFGYQLTITQRVAKFLNASFELYTGSVYGEEQRGTTNLNFRTTLFSQHLNIEYNFYPLLKPDTKGFQRFRPYIGFGVGALFFRSKGDLKDGSNNEYYYWSDNIIRDQPEGSVDPSEANILERDFVYESDLRDANLDGLKKYSQIAFTMPINAGLRVQITKNFGINVAFSYGLNFTDLLDNSNENSVGARAGNAGNDNLIYGSLGLNAFLGRSKPSAKPKQFENLVADASETEDPEQGEIAAETEVVQQSNASTENKIENDVALLNSQLTDVNNAVQANLTKINELVDKLGSKETLSRSDQEELNKAIEQQKILDKQLLKLYQDGTDLILIGSDDEKNNPLSPSEKELVSTLDELNGLARTSELDLANEEATAKELLLKMQSKLKAIDAGLRSAQDAADRLDVENQVKMLSERINNIPDLDGLSEQERQEFATSIEHEIEDIRKQNSQLDSPLDISDLENQTATVAGPILSSHKFSKDVVAFQELASVTKDQSGSVLMSASELAKSLLNEKKLSKDDRRLVESLIEQQRSVRNQIFELSEKASVLIQSSQTKTSSDLATPARDELETLLKTLDALVAKESYGFDRKSGISEATEVTESIHAENVALISVLENLNNAIQRFELEQRMHILLQEIQIVGNRSKDSNKSGTGRIELEKSLGSIEQELAAIQRINSELQDPIDLSFLESTVADVTMAEQTVDNKSSSKTKQADKSTSKVTGTGNEATDEAKASKPRTKEEIENTPPKLSGGFHWADINQNGWISPDEVLHFIDMLFEGEGARTVEDIQNLIDYYFDQE